MQTCMLIFIISWVILLTSHLGVTKSAATSFLGSRYHASTPNHNREVILSKNDGVVRIVFVTVALHGYGDKFKRHITLVVVHYGSP